MVMCGCSVAVLTTGNDALGISTPLTLLRLARPWYVSHVHCHISPLACQDGERSPGPWRPGGARRGDTSNKMLFTVQSYVYYCVIC